MTSRIEPIPRKKVGLALGGGAVRGLAHVGVLNELVLAGIPIDYVAGTSAGSLIGSLFCSGIGLERMKVLAKETNWWRISRLALSPRGFLNFDKLSTWLMKNVGDLDFADLPISFSTVAADIITGEEVVIAEGRLAPAVQASCSIPGIVTPVVLDGRLLVDGSIVNTIPVSVVRKMGADYVIGVDILTHHVRWRLGPLGYGIAAIEILAEKAGMGSCLADCMITPDLGGKSYIRFSKRTELVELGSWAARMRIDHIRRALGMIDPHEDLIP